MTHLLKLMSTIGAKRGYILVALALLGALVGAEADGTGFGHGDW